MTENDKKILKAFFIVFIILFTLGIIPFIITGNSNLVELVSAFFISLLFAFFVAGIFAYGYSRRSAIIPTKKILKWFALISIPIATVTMLMVLFFAITVQEFPKDTIVLVVMPIILFFIMFLMVILIMIVLFFESFGIVGVLVALVRAISPRILLRVSRISASKSVGNLKNKKIAKLSKRDSLISWAFAIPDVLETKTLKINHGRPRNWFPWSVFYKAMWWQTLFGAVIIVYISFNPLYVKTELDFQNLFSIASNITILVPFIILPWFIFLRLDAKIKGQVKDYQLYRGIVYRMYQTFFTLGTIIIIIRLGLERIDPGVILLTLPVYYLFFISTIFLVSFIYLNYFENGLAWEVAKKYRKVKD
jgi:hypothetical protein